MNPYREAEVPRALACPRCHQPLPPLDVAHCAAGCGAWVSAFAATEVLTDDDRRIDPLTQWWKRREPCPICAVKMLLCGARDGLLQGCEGHGYWLDADAIAHTGLAGGVDEARLQRKRDDDTRVEADREAREAAELARAHAQRDKDEREANVAARLVTAPAGIEVTSAADTWAMVALAIGPLAASFLARRFGALEQRNAELEARVAALEAARDQR